LLTTLRNGNYSIIVQVGLWILYFCLGDPAAIHPFLQEISKAKQISGESKSSGEIETGAAVLHVAV